MYCYLLIEKQSNTSIGAIGIAVAVIGLIGLTIFLLYKYIPDRIPRLVFSPTISKYITDSDNTETPLCSD